MEGKILFGSKMCKYNVWDFEDVGQSLHKTAGFIFLSFLLAFALFVSAYGQKIDKAAAIKPKRESLSHEFIEAFNTGTFEALHQFIDTHYDPEFMRGYAGDSEGTAARMLDLYRLYGTLRFHSVQNDFSPPIYWMQGVDTKGWLGLQWRENSSGLFGHTVWRTRPPTAASSPAVSPEELRKQLSRYLMRTSAKGNFSGVVLVAKNGKVLFEGAYGEAERGRRRNRLNTRFNIGSVTKMLVGTAVLRLVENGLIKLEDPIGKYIREYPQPAAQRVTIKHLLTHTSGIEFDDFPGFVEARREAETIENILKVQLRYANQAKIDQPGFRPTNEFDYSNDNLELLGVILQRASGKLWEDTVREQVLIPAGMKNTTFAMFRERRDVAIGYTAFKGDTDTYSPGPRSDAAPLLLKRASPSGQMYSTTRDLHSFLRAILDHRLLSAEMTKQMFSFQADAGELKPLRLQSAYGYTIQISTGYGVTTKGHGGVVPGYSAQVQWYPDLGYEVVVLSNFGDTAAHIAASYIENLITDL